jgi:hypothetical protein
MSSDTEIRPFRVDMSEEAIADLRRRIDAMRWPGQEPLPFTSGTSVSACPVFGVALRAGHDFGWRSGTDVNATRPLL